jgi:23S rRNA pseudouridine2605 synthase
MKFATLVIACNLCYQPACLSMNAAMIRKNNDRRGGPTPHRLRRSDPPPSGEGEGNRIAKVLARAGVCSRRQAEEWIAAGRVAVNGGTISLPAVNVTERDSITIDGKPLPRRERTRLFLYHKPVGLVSTNADPQGRPTVFDALPRNLPRLMSVGRLDIGTEGLLLLTNDGGLARVLELPDTGWVRRYRVRAHGRVSQGDLDRLRDGITVEGVHYGPIEASLEREQGTNVWLSFAIREGKNREVRNVLAHLGLQVNRLIRIEFGPFGLGGLAEGAIEEVATKNLRAQLGARIIAQAGCDFGSPITARVLPNPPPHAGEGWVGATGEGKGGGLSREERRELRRMLRDRPHGGRRGEHAARPDSDDRRLLRKSERDERPEKPPGRPRRGHAWRKDDAPLRRTYRGSRRDDLKIADEARPDKRAGLMTDRKGRRILVERFGTKTEKPQPAEAPARGRSRRTRPPPDRASGPRPSRPRFSDERSVEARPGKPRKFGSPIEGRRKGGRGEARPHSPGPSPSRPRPSGPRPPQAR